MTRKTNRATHETHTIQLWPGGQSIEYRGDPDGSANQKSLRAGHFETHLRCVNSCHAETWSERDDKPEGKTGHQYTGRRVFFRGRDEHDELQPVECESCTNGYTDNPKRNPWRKGTAEEWRRVRIEVRAELYGSRDILGCDSSLVSDLLSNGGSAGNDLAEAFDMDAPRNLYADPSDWDAARCREYADDNGIDLPEVPKLEGEVPDDFPVRPLKDDDPATDRVTCGTCDRSWDDAIGTSYTPAPGARCPFEAFHEGADDPDALEDDSRHGWLTEAREACQEHAQENPAEVYEWWRVSSWLCDQLHAIGEVTIDNDYGTWWGRTCTGQGWIMDGTLQKVAARHVREEEAYRDKINAVADVVAGKGEQS